MPEQFGYYFHPARQAGSAGHPQLDINLYEEATKEHFDPQRATFWVVGSDGDVVQTTIRHPWRGQQHLRVCAGRIIMVDRKGKVVEAFSLGGDLKVTVHDSYTGCELTSSAPIIHLQNTQDLPTDLVNEFEALLARLHARWYDDDTGFKTKLATIDPFTLFVAGLVAIKEQLDQTLAHLHDDRHRQASHLIDQAIETIQKNGKWPATPPNLSDLL
jgi:hypothetical protein